jgi:hypothetical protein
MAAGRGLITIAFSISADYSTVDRTDGRILSVAAAAIATGSQTAIGTTVTRSFQLCATTVTIAAGSAAIIRAGAGRLVFTTGSVSTK